MLISGSFRAASKHVLPIWAQTAKLAFNHTKDEKYVKSKGVFDKSIIECAFREDLRKRKYPDADGGCNDFEPSLTTNGMCYTFNGIKTSELWKSSEMMSTFAKLFPSHSESNKNFGGSKTVQGK